MPCKGTLFLFIYLTNLGYLSGKVFSYTIILEFKMLPKNASADKATELWQQAEEPISRYAETPRVGVLR